MTCSLGIIRPGQPVDISLLIHGDVTPRLETWHASVTAHETDPDTSNNSASRNFQIAAVADLSMAFTMPSDTLDRGSSMQLTATASNQGPNGASGVLLSVALPVRLGFQSATLSTGGSCSLNGSNTVECPVGVLAVSGSATVTINVVGALAGTDSITAQVSSSSTFDSEQANNFVSRAIVIGNAVNGAVQMTAPGSGAPGQALPYTATITNAGTENMLFPTLTFTVQGAALQSATPPAPGNCVVSGDTATCELDTIPGGGTATVTLNATPASAGTVTATATLTFAGTDPDRSNNAATTTTTVTSGTTTPPPPPPTSNAGGGGGGGGSLGLATLLGLLLTHLMRRRPRRIPAPAAC